MKKKLLSILSLGAMALAFSSNSGGPLGSNTGNRTGTAGSIANCTDANCHAANSSSTLLTIVVSKNGTPVTSFLPDSTYTVMITGAVTNANLPKFGFQFAAVDAANTSTQAGTLTAVTTNTAVRNASGGLKILEHTTALSGVGAGTTWAYTATATWKAPSASTNISSVGMYLTLNAVNGNSSTSGDQPNATSITLANGLSVSEVSGWVSLKSYPNPATSAFNLTAEGVGNGNYQIHVVNIAGQNVIEPISLRVSNGKIEETLNVSDLYPGLYFVNVMDEAGAAKRIPLAKI